MVAWCLARSRRSLGDGWLQGERESGRCRTDSDRLHPFLRTRLRSLARSFVHSPGLEMERPQTAQEQGHAAGRERKREAGGREAGRDGRRDGRKYPLFPPRSFFSDSVFPSLPPSFLRSFPLSLLESLGGKFARRCWVRSRRSFPRGVARRLLPERGRKPRGKYVKV